MNDRPIAQEMGIVHIEVLKGSSSFAQACRVAAMTLGMVACAQTAAAPQSNAPTLQAASVSAPGSLDLPFDARPAVPPTPASLKLNTLLPDQKAKAEPVSQEQMKVLQYGEHPPVKTTVRINGKLETQWTLHPFDLVRLAREAASKASALEGIRIDPAKVGAVMIAESSMVSRVGWSANGKTPSFGLAQLEERTARSLGVKDLNDPRESALAAARLVAEGQKLANANRQVNPSLVASLAYNTSSATRKLLISHYGSELRVEHLPTATQHHVKNMAFGEQRMNMFAKLRDQHIKAVMSSAQLVAQTLSPTQQETTMSTPRPSTRTLVSNIATDNANQARLRNNQLALERAGHVQAIPMTSQGLNDLRQAVSTHIQRMSAVGTPNSNARKLDPAPMAVVLSSMGEKLGAVVRSLLDKARETFAEISGDLKAAASTESAKPSQVSSAMLSNQDITAATARQARAAILEMREAREQRLAEQNHPGYMPS